jgi:hypothetical protein
MPNKSSTGNPTWKEGTTYPYMAGDIIYIHIAYELIEPLFHPDLTAVEKKLDHFRLAVTILHELCVGQTSSIP